MDVTVKPDEFYLYSLHQHNLKQLDYKLYKTYRCSYAVIP